MMLLGREERSNLWELIEYYIEKVGSLESYCKWKGARLKDGKEKEIMISSFCKSCFLEERGSMWSLNTERKPSFKWFWCRAASMQQALPGICHRL